MSSRWYHLCQAIVCKASGKDARRYLNNRLSNDLRSLTYPDSVIAAALTAQGRAQGVYTVFATPDEAFLLVCDGGARQSLFASLGKFIVADRVSLEDVSSAWTLVHAVVSEEEARGVAHDCGGERVYMRASRRLGEPGFDLLLPTDSVAESLEKVAAKLGAAMTASEYSIKRLRQGQPAFPDEVNEKVILTECGMREAVSFSKGCYVGQEVIERGDAIGKLPRTLERVVFMGAGVARDGSVTNARGESIGRIMSVVTEEASATSYAFALLRSGVYSDGDDVSCDGVQGHIKRV